MKLRPINYQDIQFLYESIKEFSEYLEELQIKREVPPFEQHERFVKKYLEDYENHPFKAWYIVENEGTRIGNFTVKKNNEFGYNIKKQYQGKGLGTKSFELFFKIHPKEEVWARTNIKNERSQKILKKFGFVLSDYEFHYRIG